MVSDVSGGPVDSLGAQATAAENGGAKIDHSATV